jgi:hypothetical protein
MLADRSRLELFVVSIALTTIGTTLLLTSRNVLCVLHCLRLVYVCAMRFYDLQSYCQSLRAARLLGGAFVGKISRCTKPHELHHTHGIERLEYEVTAHQDKLTVLEGSSTRGTAQQNEWLIRPGLVSAETS